MSTNVVVLLFAVLPAVLCRTRFPIFSCLSFATFADNIFSLKEPSLFLALRLLRAFSRHDDEEPDKVLPPPIPSSPFFT